MILYASRYIAAVRLLESSRYCENRNIPGRRSKNRECLPSQLYVSSGDGLQGTHCSGAGLEDFSLELHGVQSPNRVFITTTTPPAAAATTTTTTAATATTTAATATATATAAATYYYYYNYYYYYYCRHY